MDESGTLVESSSDTKAWDREMARLRKYNQYCGALHFIQGSAMLMLSFFNDDAVAMLMPVTSVFQDWDSGYPVQVLGRITQITFVRWSSYFALLSAAAHFTVLMNWDTYTSDLAKGLNRFRWFEYALSSSLIIVLLCMLWGYFDFVQLSGIFVINACMNLFGDQHEAINSGKAPKDVNWTSFIYGGMCGSVTWIMLWSGIYNDDNKSDYPVIAWFYIVTYQLLFFSFPIVMYNQYKQNGKFNNALYPDLKNGGYLHGERVY